MLGPIIAYGDVAFFKEEKNDAWVCVGGSGCRRSRARQAALAPRAQRAGAPLGRLPLWPAYTMAAYHYGGVAFLQ